MPSYARTAVVTGANKGIGLAVVKHLALQYPSSAFNNGPLLIYLTARDQKRGEDAVASLQKDETLKKAKALSQDGGLSTVKYHGLDISKPQSIKDLAGFLKTEHPEGIDILVNNAGISVKGFDINVVTETLQCNYYGTLQATQSLLPLIRPGGRVVNVASTGGHLNKYSPAITQQFASSETVEDVTKLMQAFSRAVEAGNEQEQGWPRSAYSVSKAGMIGFTRALALDGEQKKSNAEGFGVLLNSCCPGWVITDMTKGQGARKTVDQGAQTPVLLALGDIKGTSGEFWRSEQVVQW